MLIREVLTTSLLNMDRFLGNQALLLIKSVLKRPLAVRSLITYCVSLISVPDVI